MESNKNYREEKNKQFRNEVRDILSGVIADKDAVNYIVLKISRIHDRHVTDILKERLFSN